jgi:hypothetical protein
MITPRENIRMMQQCTFWYGLNSMNTNELEYHVVPLDIFNVLLGHPYIHDRYEVYEFKPQKWIVKVKNLRNIFK